MSIIFYSGQPKLIQSPNENPASWQRKIQHRLKCRAHTFPQVRIDSKNPSSKLFECLLKIYIITLLAITIHQANPWPPLSRQNLRASGPSLSDLSGSKLPKLPNWRWSVGQYSHHHFEALPKQHSAKNALDSYEYVEKTLWSSWSLLSWPCLDILLIDDLLGNTHFCLRMLAIRKYRMTSFRLKSEIISKLLFRVLHVNTGKINQKLTIEVS